MPFVVDIDLEMINILIEKEKNEQNDVYEEPFLQLPIPHPLIPEKKEDKEENLNNDGIIIIDL